MVARRQAHRDREPAAARSRPTTAIPSATTTSRRRSSPNADAFRLWTGRRAAARRLPARAKSSPHPPRERPARRRVRSRVGDAAAPLLLDRSVGGAVAGAAAPSIARRPQAAQDEAALETVDRRDGRRAAADQAAGDVQSRRGRLGASARVAGRRPRARARRQHRRRRDRRVVRARRRRARSVGHRRRRHGAALPEGHERAGRDRLQGSGADPRDARQPAAASAAPAMARRRRTSLASSPGSICCTGSYGSKKMSVERPDRAGDRVRGERLRARRGAADVDCRRAAVLREVPASARIYLPGRNVPKAGDRFVNKDYASTLRTIAKDGAERSIAASIARRIADDMARNGGLISVDDLAQYRAIERRPLVGPLSRPCGLLGAAAGVDRRGADRDAADPRSLRAEAPARPTRSDADYLHYAIEAWRVRDQGPRIADPALWDVNLGPHLDAGARGDAVQAHRSPPRSIAIAAARRATGRPSASAAARRRSRSPTPTAT